MTETARNPIQCEQATKVDLQAIRRLLELSDLPHSDICAEKLERFLVVRSEGRIAGVIGFEQFDNIALIRSLAVAPAHRGRGIGAMLLASAEKRANTGGVSEVYTLTETAREYLTLRGYRQIDRADMPLAIRAHAQFRDLCPESATALRKDLNS